MRAFLGSVAVAIIVAVGAMFALEGAWTPADKAFTTSGVRVDTDHNNPMDHNLVGKDWWSSRQF